MKRALLFVVVVAVALATYSLWSTRVSTRARNQPAARRQTGALHYDVTTAFQSRRSNVQVRGRGVVTRILKDDLVGGRHQRFILKMDSGQTLLVAHNIDVAPRIPGLTVGEVVSFLGEYEWNRRGGVLHWTHRDPANRHIHGWLKHRGKSYE